MLRFIIRRIIFTLISLFILTGIIFFVSELVPISIATNVLGDNVTNDQIAAFDAQNGLDQPPLKRYWRWLAGLNQGQRIDRILTVTRLVIASTPEFASGIFLITIFSPWLGWLPGAVVLIDDTDIFTRPAQLVLPILTLMFIELGYILRLTRASLIEVLQEPYIRTATLKGLSRRHLVFRHAFKNAMIAPITVMILHINTFIGSIIVIEVIFGFPGVGRYVLESALSNDLFALEASAIVLVIIDAGTQMLADIVYVYLNPRIRYR